MNRALLARAFAYVAVATALGVAVGFLREGSVGGALALGFAVAVGVAAGLLGFELFRRYGPG